MASSTRPTPSGSTSAGSTSAGSTIARPEASLPSAATSGASNSGASKSGASVQGASAQGTSRKRRGRSAPSYLTERQRAILEFIEESQRRRSIAPTHREICEHFGYSSYGTVYKHLKLLEQKGFLTRDWNQKRGIELTRPVRAEDDGDLPFLGRIAAGQPIQALSEPETLQVPSHLLRPRSGGEHFVLQVMGDSMIDEGIHDGDFVVLLRRQTAAPGEMVVALVEDQDATLKRFYPEGPMVRLQPSHPTMEPILVDARQVKIQGVVVGLMRRYA